MNNKHKNRQNHLARLLQQRGGVVQGCVGGVALGPSVVGLRLLAVALFISAGVTLSCGGEARPEKKLPLPGEAWRIDGHAAFLIPAAEPPPAGRPKPWVWYAPTLPPYPGEAERWMFDRFTRAGVAIAGIDVGDSSGTKPSALALTIAEPT